MESEYTAILLRELVVLMWAHLDTWILWDVRELISPTPTAFMPAIQPLIYAMGSCKLHGAIATCLTKHRVPCVQTLAFVSLAKDV